MAQQHSLAGSVCFVAMALAMLAANSRIAPTTSPAPVKSAAAPAPGTDAVTTSQAAPAAPQAMTLTFESGDESITQNLVAMEELTLQSLMDALQSRAALNQPTQALAEQLRGEIASIQSRMRTSGFDSELSARRWSALEAADRALETLGSSESPADAEGSSSVTDASPDAPASAG